MHMLFVPPQLQAAVFPLLIRHISGKGLARSFFNETLLNFIYLLLVHVYHLHGYNMLMSPKLSDPKITSMCDEKYFFKLNVSRYITCNEF